MCTFSGREVKHCLADRAGFTDADAGAEHELDEVRQIQSDCMWVGAQPGQQIGRLPNGERPDAFARAGDRSGVAYRVDSQRAVAHGAAA
jgi:hypothetical protein